jgi:hypothetical protein
MSYKANYKGSVIAITLLLILFFSAYYFKDILLPKANVTLALGTDCNLQYETCSLQIDTSKTVSFSITPKSIPVLKDLSLTVLIQGINANAVSISFVGVNMDMGLNHVQLTRVDKAHWQGIGQIPICSHGKMLWEAQVILHTPQGVIKAPFQFSS